MSWNTVWHGRRMEKLRQPPKPSQRWRGWVKPIIFTALLYAGLGGVVYCSYEAKNTQEPPKLTQPSPVSPSATQAQAVPPTYASTANKSPASIAIYDVYSANMSKEQSKNQLVSLPAQQPVKVASQQIGQTSLIELSAQQVQNNISSLPQSQTESISPKQTFQSTASIKNDPRSKAMDSAEAEAEVQNEMLREAIDKVKQLNDNKIAKAREEVTESSVPAYPSIIKDDEEPIQINNGNESE